MATSTIYKKRYLSLARRLWREDWDESKVREVYGDEASQDGIGQNLALVVGLQEVTPLFEKQFEKVFTQLDHRFLNEHLAFFTNVLPTLESILLWIVNELRSFPLLEVWLEEPGFQRALWEAKPNIASSGNSVTYSRNYQVRCVHRHHNPELSAEENKALFHKCSGLHGHDYRIEVFVTCTPHSETGVCVDRGRLQRAVNQEIIRPFDRTYLNDKMGNTSGELISQQFYTRLKSSLPELSELRVRETQKNSFFIK